MKEKMKTLPAEYLWDGLVLKDDIYNHNGNVLLIPSGEEITRKSWESSLILVQTVSISWSMKKAIIRSWRKETFRMKSVKK